MKIKADSFLICFLTCLNITHQNRYCSHSSNSTSSNTLSMLSVEAVLVAFTSFDLHKKKHPLGPERPFILISGDRRVSRPKRWCFCAWGWKRRTIDTKPDRRLLPCLGIQTTGTTGIQESSATSVSVSSVCQMCVFSGARPDRWAVLHCLLAPEVGVFRRTCKDTVLKHSAECRKSKGLRGNTTTHTLVGGSLSSECLFLCHRT